MRDFQGNVIQPGDYVLVAQRKGSNLWLVRKFVASVDAVTGVPYLKHGDKVRKYQGSSDAIAVTVPAQASV